MLRRSFIAIAALVLTGKTSPAQQTVRATLRTKAILDFQTLITQALSIASQVEKDAETMLRTLVAEAYNKSEIPDVSLGEIPPNKIPDVVVFARNVPELLFTVLQESKGASGQIAVTVVAVQNALRKVCPFFPFC